MKDFLKHLPEMILDLVIVAGFIAGVLSVAMILTGH